MYIYTVYTRRFKGYCLLPQLNVNEKKCYKCTHGKIQQYKYTYKGGITLLVPITHLMQTLAHSS